MNRLPIARTLVCALPVLLAMALALGGCAVTARTAQRALEPFQVYVRAPEGQAEASGLAAGMNARYLAVAGHARGRLEVWAPTGAGPTLVWSAEYDGDYRPHAWEIRLWEEDGAEWLQVAPATWADARASLHWLPALDRPRAAGARLGPPASGSAAVRVGR